MCGVCGECLVCVAYITLNLERKSAKPNHQCSESQTPLPPLSLNCNSNCHWIGHVEVFPISDPRSQAAVGSWETSSLWEAHLTFINQMLRRILPKTHNNAIIFFTTGFTFLLLAEGRGRAMSIVCIMICKFSNIDNKLHRWELDKHRTVRKSKHCHPKPRVAESGIPRIHRERGVAWVAFVQVV